MKSLPLFSAFLILALGCQFVAQHPNDDRIVVDGSVPTQQLASELNIDVEYAEPWSGGHGTVLSRAQSEVGSSSLTDGVLDHTMEERLLAIDTNGFYVGFTVVDKTRPTMQVTNTVVLFPFDRTTQTNVFGHKLTGSYD